MTADTVDEEPQSSPFLAGLVFLTGEDPSAGSFLLVVGLVTCLFIAAFQFLLQAPVSDLLTALVVVVAVISFLMGAILDILGYFERPANEA
ncbi:hypothetical protein [Haloarcula montana]|uniref:hypothetical protein n=1 Tax=Haloarcula montana TaxID=3111776 RepID=UPI002D76F59C|nr:hypothetical protein [Haloarcula sp. GH36]